MLNIFEVLNRNESRIFQTYFSIEGKRFGRSSECHAYIVNGKLSLFVLVSESRALIFTDFRYLEQTKNECPGFEIVQILGGYEPLAKVVSDMNLECVSFEPRHTSYADHQRIRSTLMDDIFLNPAEGAVESLRTTKDESEIELLQTAVNLADSAMEQALQSVHSGVAEIEVAKVFA